MNPPEEDVEMLAVGKPKANSKNYEVPRNKNWMNSISQTANESQGTRASALLDQEQSG